MYLMILLPSRSLEFAKWQQARLDWAENLLYVARELYTYEDNLERGKQDDVVQAVRVIIILSWNEIGSCCHDAQTNPIISYSDTCRVSPIKPTLLQHRVQTFTKYQGLNYGRASTLNCMEVAKGKRCLAHRSSTSDNRELKTSLAVLGAEWPHQERIVGHID